MANQIGSRVLTARHVSVAGICMALWVALGVSAPARAQAQYVCPNGAGPGEIQVGIMPADGSRPALPLCVPDNSAPSTAPRGPDPMETATSALVQATNGLADTMQKVLGAYGSLMKDASRQLGWRYSAPGQNCSATYYSLDGFVRIDGPAKGQTRPLLTFYSARIDRPNGSRPVDIAFENSSADSGQTATLAVKGLNWPSGGGNGGFISLQLASTPILIKGLEDRMRFKLTVARKTVVDLTWDRGNEAKARLGNCLGLR